jgi:hypothetical protein
MKSVEKPNLNFVITSDPPSPTNNGAVVTMEDCRMVITVPGGIKSFDDPVFGKLYFYSADATVKPV